MQRRLSTGALAIALAVALSCIPARATAHEPGEDTDAPPMTAPVLIEKVQPQYPEVARQSGIGGVISMAVTVEANGSVGDVKVLKGAGFGLDEAAVAAVKKFRFTPAMDHGKPIASVITFDQSFVVRPHLSAEVEATESRPSATPETAPAPVGDMPAQIAPSSTTYESTLETHGPLTAASSTTVRNLDFDLRPKTSPNDILRVVPGLLAVQHQGGGKADQLFLRGFDADHGTDVGVFVDGVPVNMPSHAHGQGFADLHWLIPEAVERIDVVKGPYDARYGDFATAGSVNLITRKRFDESSVQMTLGGFPTESGRLIATQRFVGIASPRFAPGGFGDKLHPWIAFEAAHDDGPFVTPENLRRYNLFGKVSYDLSPSTTVGMFFQAYGSQWVGSGQIPAREVVAGRLPQFGAIDPSEGGLTERQMTTAFLHHKDGASEFNATFYVTRYRLSLFDDFTFFFEDPVNGSEIVQDDSRVFSGARMDYHFHRHWHGVSFRSTVGAEARWDSVHVDRWDAESQNGDFRKRLGRHVDTSELALHGNNLDIVQEDIAAFVEEDVKLDSHFRVVGALRADYVGFNVSDQSEVFGPGQPNTSGVAQKAILSPKLSAIITPLPSLLDIYLNFGEGFHTNMAQVALLDGTTHTSPTNPASSFTIRAVPKYYAGEIGARLHLWNRVDLAGALWASYLENETVFDADHSAFSPSSPTRRIGTDLEVRVEVLPWLFADLDLAQAQSTAVPDHGNGGAVALAPRLYMTGGLTARHAASGVRGGLRFRFLGERPAFDETSPDHVYFTSRTLPDGRPNPDYNPDRVNTAGYFIVDAYVAYRWRFIEASLSAQNVSDSAWREAQFGNHSCTYDETYNPANPNYNGSGNQLSDGTYVNRCGIAHQKDQVRGAVTDTRSGVTDVHFTPGVPLDLQATLKVYF